MKKFIILSLPRSRSFWLSRFLSFGELQCGHDLCVDCGNVEDFISAFGSIDGTIETGAILGWRLIQHLLPQVQLIVVRRPVRDVFHSFEKLGIPVEATDLFTRALMLDQLASQPFVKTWEYRELEDESACAKLFETCTGRQHSPAWWRGMRNLNIQIDMGERMAHLIANASRLEQFRASVLAQQAELAPGGFN